MDFFDALKYRRSCRKYSDKSVPPEVIEKALMAAQLAPNSSNLQTWDFYWVQSEDKKQKLKLACLNQSAARTAPELIVCVSKLSKWKKNSQQIVEHYKKNGKPHEQVINYYTKLIPFLYSTWFLAPVTWALYNTIGLFRPIPRRPISYRDLEEVSIKSAALACENFMLAIAAQKYDTCPMEGFDECRVKKILSLPLFSRVVMVISIGERASDGIWGEQFRVPANEVVHKV
jgi:nitroreductase